MNARSEQIRHYTKSCAYLITPPVTASGSISISTPFVSFALPTLKVDRMDTIASHIYQRLFRLLAGQAQNKIVYLSRRRLGQGKFCT